jgi:predicted MFS family arabinose efflux permease
VVTAGEEGRNSDRGSAREALAQRDFRLLFAASFVSNTGTWMQQVVLGIFAWNLTHSSAFLGQIIFAQLGPMLFLSVVGGSLADTMDRRRLLLVTQLWQGLWSLVLAWQVGDGHIGRAALLGLVFMIGIGQALYAPTFSAVLPSLVGRRNMSAAISLNSVQMNGSRIIGPALGGWLASILGVGPVVTINAASFVIVIVALLLVKCLPFIGQMPAVAELNLGVDPESTAYGVLYACFGMGALVGAASVGTFLLHASKPKVVRVGLLGFGLSLGAFSLVHQPAPAYAIVFLVGLFYFVMPTALNTFLQEHLSEQVRGRVMALWVLSFGGTVPLTNLLAGPLVDLTSVTAVLLFGAAAAVVLAGLTRLEAGDEVGEEILLDPAQRDQHASSPAV